MTDKDENLGSQVPSKAAILATELKTEKKRLQEELDELHTQYEDIKPTTPTGTVDWFVKWFAVICAVIGVFMITAGLVIYGQIFYVVSSIAWIYVGMSWGDRAIMIGSSITGTAVMMKLVEYFITL